MPKILLSSSHFHFNPKVDENKYYHSTGLTVKVFYQALKTFGDVDIINDKDTPTGLKYDVLVSWPRNYEFLVKNNEFKEKIVFLNAAEPNYLKMVMLQEVNRLGCKLSDCFYFRGIQGADAYFVLGRLFNRQRYIDVGIPDGRMFDAWYNTSVIPFKPRNKNKRPIFLHMATTLGLRKGFWWAVEDFLKADIDAELWCVGKVQKEKFWIDYAVKAAQDPRVKIIGWVDFESPRQIELFQKADFMVFPSFGEGQAGTVVEAMCGGCIPIVSRESGVPYFPIGEYVRGEVGQYHRAYQMSNEEFRSLQLKGQKELNENYNNEVFIEQAKHLLKRYFHG